MKTMTQPMHTTPTRRGFFAALIAAAAVAVIPDAQARGRSGGRRLGRSSGGARGGCGSRGGPGYRKANGKCASHQD